jgi:hypothetical protein
MKKGIAMRTLMVLIFGLFASSGAANAQSACGDYQKWPNVMTIQGKIWFPRLGVKNPHVFSRSIGCLEIGAQYPIIYRKFTSHNPSEITDALDRINFIDGNP